MKYEAIIPIVVRYDVDEEPAQKFFCHNQYDSVKDNIMWGIAERIRGFVDDNTTTIAGETDSVRVTHVRIDQPACDVANRSRYDQSVYMTPLASQTQLLYAWNTRRRYMTGHHALENKRYGFLAEEIKPDDETVNPWGIILSEGEFVLPRLEMSDDYRQLYKAIILRFREKMASQLESILVEEILEYLEGISEDGLIPENTNNKKEATL